MGEAFRRLIGILYISDDKQFVKISHLSFFGRRIDAVLPVREIVPLSDSDEELSDVFVWVYTYASLRLDGRNSRLFDIFRGNGQFLLCLRFGGVVDREAFETVFGKCLD